MVLFAIIFIIIMEYIKEFQFSKFNCFHKHLVGNILVLLEFSGNLKQPLCVLMIWLNFLFVNGIWVNLCWIWVKLSCIGFINFESILRWIKKDWLDGRKVCVQTLGVGTHIWVQLNLLFFTLYREEGFLRNVYSVIQQKPEYQTRWMF